MKIAIIGVGLIGGSFALALRRERRDIHVIGIDRDAAALTVARQIGVIDEAAHVGSIASCDVVMLAVPVRQLPLVLTEIAPILTNGTLLTDTGSTKQDVVAAARLALADKISQFVPGHPIAGREHAGVAAADPTLFDGKNVVLTPIPESSRLAIERAQAIWLACGARVIEMSAQAHDAVFAAVSHLPHLLAFALVDDLAARPNAKTLFSFAASGFRDFTRIAASSPEMWRDISLNNSDALLKEITAYETYLANLKRALSAGDGPALELLMSRAQDARARWMAGDLDQFRDEAT